MRAPLSVRIDDGVTSRMVTRHVTGLKFRKTAPGGHADASCNVNLPAGTFADLGPTDRLYIYDGTTGRTLWDGYTNNPGNQTGRDGQGLDLSALGGQSRLSDATSRLVYLDSTLNAWVQDTTYPQAPSGTAQVSDGPDGSGTLQGVSGLYLQFNPGHPVDPAYQLGLMYTGLVGSDQTIGGIVGQYDAGLNSSGDYTIYIYTGPGSSFTDVLNTSVNPLVLFAGGGSLTTGQQRLFYQMWRTGAATNVATDTVWSLLANVTVLGQLLDRHGNVLNMATAAHVSVPDVYILASDIVEDLLGRVLTFCNPDTATVEPTTYAVDQLAYTDGVKPMQVLDDLGLFEPDMVYEILETDTTGRHRFNYRAWSTTPRYLIPADMPVDQPGSDMDLCNRVLVTYTDPKGNPKVVEVTSTVPELDAVGRVRDADPVTLPDSRSSLANAQRIGAQILASKATPPRAATVVVDRPIMDMLWGRWVEPWEIEPGYLGHLASTGDDLRLTEMEYDDDAYASTLTLGEPVLTEDQRIARLERGKS